MLISAGQKFSNGTFFCQKLSWLVKVEMFQKNMLILLSLKCHRVSWGGVGVRKEGIHQNPLADPLTICLLGCRPCGTAKGWSLGQSAMQKTCWWTSGENSCFLDGSCKYRSQGACLICPAAFHWTPAWERARRMAYQHSQVRYFRQLSQTFSSAYKREGLNFVLGFLLGEKDELLWYYLCSFELGLLQV